MHWNKRNWGTSKLPFFKFGYVHAPGNSWRTMQGRLYLGWFHVEL